MDDLDLDELDELLEQAGPPPPPPPPEDVEEKFGEQNFRVLT